MLRRRTAAAGCALAISALTLVAGPAVAAPNPGAASSSSAASSSAPAPKPPPAMLEAMQRDLNLTSTQVEARLANEARAAAIEPVVRKELNDAFAGSWVTGTTADTLVIATTDSTKVSKILAAGAQPKIVQHSIAKLTAAKEALDKAASKAYTNTPVWYVDVPTNKVVVRSSQPAEAESFIAASGVDASLVKVEQSAEKPRALYDLRGGDRYTTPIGDYTYICSIGFSVRKGSSNGFVTAGHCGDTAAPTRGYNGVSQGTFQGFSFPINDYGWVAVNSNWTPRPWVKGSSGNVTVTGSAVAVVGSSVCRSGQTTGWHCGTVQQLNTSVRYSQGIVTQVTRTNVCAEGGDSGGAFISGSQAQGVTSGGHGDCKNGGITYFQPVNEILSVYGLTLVTSGGGIVCSGYQSSYSGSLNNRSGSYKPKNSGYYSAGSGTHRACLDGPDGTDFDLYLQKWNGSFWQTVAGGVSANADETISYRGTAGTYRYLVYASRGSGSYTLRISKP